MQTSVQMWSRLVLVSLWLYFSSALPTITLYGFNRNLTLTRSQDGTTLVVWMQYRIQNGLVNIPPYTLYSPSYSRTSTTIFQEAPSSAISFIPQTVREWNSLSKKTTSASLILVTFNFFSCLCCSTDKLQPPLVTALAVYSYIVLTSFQTWTEAIQSVSKKQKKELLTPTCPALQRKKKNKEKAMKLSNQVKPLLLFLLLIFLL